MKTRYNARYEFKPLQTSALTLKEGFITEGLIIPHRYLIIQRWTSWSVFIFVHIWSQIRIFVKQWWTSEHSSDRLSEVCVCEPLKLLGVYNIIVCRWFFVYSSRWAQSGEHVLPIEGKGNTIENDSFGGGTAIRTDHITLQLKERWIGKPGCVEYLLANEYSTGRIAWLIPLWNDRNPCHKRCFRRCEGNGIFIK